MLNAAALAFVVGSTAWNQPDGQAMFLLVITLAAAEASEDSVTQKLRDEYVQQRDELQRLYY